MCSFLLYNLIYEGMHNIHYLLQCKMVHTFDCIHSILNMHTYMLYTLMYFQNNNFFLQTCAHMYIMYVMYKV